MIRLIVFLVLIVPAIVSAGTYQVMQYGESYGSITAGGAAVDGWTLTDTTGTLGSATTHTVTLSNSEGSDRAGQLRYNISVSKTGLYWMGADYETETLLTSESGEFENEIASGYQTPLGDYQPRPYTLFAGVYNGSTGYAVACDPTIPVAFTTRYDADNEQLYIVFWVGFTSSITSATFKFLEWNFTPTWGLRQVAEDFYGMFPDYYTNRFKENSENIGLWINQNLSTHPLDGVAEDFYVEHCVDGSQATNTSSGIRTIKYINYSENYVTTCTADDDTYNEAIARLNTCIAAETEACLIIEDSGVKDSEGNYVVHFAGTSNDYCRFLVNPAPGITGNDQFTYQWTDFVSSFGETTISGIMLDNSEFFYWRHAYDSGAATEKTPIDFNTAHFAAMDYPLTYDTSSNVGIPYDAMGYQYLKEVRDQSELYDYFFYLSANGQPHSTTHLSLQLDMTGGETTWWTGGSWSPIDQTNMMKFRVAAGPKLMYLIQNPDEWDTWTDEHTERYFSRAAWVAALPTFFVDGDTDYYFRSSVLTDAAKPFFKKYIPAIIELATAGWDATTDATTNNTKVKIEKYGDADEDGIYFVIYNPESTSEGGVLTLSNATDYENHRCTELITGNKIKMNSEKINYQIAAYRVAIFKLEKPESLRKKTVFTNTVIN
jgi:hypothetical protein